MNHKKTSQALLLSTIALGFGCSSGQQKEAPASSDKIPFKGVVKLDVRESVPDWAPFIPKKAPADAPNILFILYDDTGLGAWSPYGGRISMPTMDKLAANGLTYTQWHTCALCSPTRSTLLTDRIPWRRDCGIVLCIDRKCNRRCSVYVRKSRSNFHEVHCSGPLTCTISIIGRTAVG